jgi:hypothetical protein
MNNTGVRALARARLKPALSTVAREEAPLNNVQKSPIRFKTPFI